MPHSFYCLCPLCFAEDSLSDDRCYNCDALVRFDNRGIQAADTYMSVPNYYQLLQKALKVESMPNAVDKSGVEPQPLRQSGPAMLRRGDSQLPFSGYHRIFQMILALPRPVLKGHLAIFPDHIEFRRPTQKFRWELQTFCCVTTNGHRFEFRTRGEDYYQIEFEAESELKYEIIFRKWLQDGYRRLGRESIAEFQPQIRTQPSRLPERTWALQPARRKEPRYVLERTIMGGFAGLVRVLLLPFVKVTIEGRDTWSGFERGIVIANHQSAADGFILGAHLDHHVAWLTKSTSFGSWFPRNFLKWTLSIPTTRYRTDVAVIRFVRNMLKKGIRVGIFPEGERCWDGQIKPFRRGTVKLLIAAGQPIYPVIFKGAFEFWPRWASAPKTSHIRITICPPFSLLPNGGTIEEQCCFLEDFFREILSD